MAIGVGIGVGMDTREAKEGEKLEDDIRISFHTILKGGAAGEVVVEGGGGGRWGGEWWS